MVGIIQCRADEVADLRDFIEKKIVEEVRKEKGRRQKRGTYEDGLVADDARGEERFRLPAEMPSDINCNNRRLLRLRWRARREDEWRGRGRGYFWLIGAWRMPLRESGAESGLWVGSFVSLNWRRSNINPINGPRL